MPNQSLHVYESNRLPTKLSAEHRRINSNVMIKPLLRRIADILIVAPVRYIRWRSSIGPQLVARRLDELSTMHNHAVIGSAKYAESHMQTAMAFEDKETMWTYVLGLCEVDGLYSEFGVWKGNSINHFARLLNGRKIYGFD